MSLFIKRLKSLEIVMFIYAFIVWKEKISVVGSLLIIENNGQKFYFHSTSPLKKIYSKQMWHCFKNDWEKKNQNVF